MKLELKHLAPYLPYKLELQILEHPFGIVPRKLELDCGHDFNYHLQEGNVKPILRPLINYNSHSFNNCFSYDEKAECFISDNGETIIEFSNIDLPYWFTQLLFEQHFDVFCLIEKGLAIDKNTLSK